MQKAECTFGDLEPGQAVRVKTVGGLRFVTRLGYAPRDSVAGVFAQAETPFQAERVDSLWVHGHAVGTGALVGAVVAPGRVGLKRPVLGVGR